MSVLPKKPSALIRIGLADLERVERSPRYCVDMGRWHQPIYGNKTVCAVCFAGAIMAMTLKAPRDKNLVPEDFSSRNRNSLAALDWFRMGVVGCGLGELGYAKSTITRVCEKVCGKNHEVVEITTYAANPKRFRAEMTKMAKKFERAGF